MSWFMFLKKLEDVAYDANGYVTSISCTVREIDSCGVFGKHPAPPCPNNIFIVRNSGHLTCGERSVLRTYKEILFKQLSCTYSR